MLHTKYQRPGPSGFRKKDFLSFQLKNLFFSSCDLGIAMDRNHLNNFGRGPTKARSCEVWSKSNQWFRRRCRLKKSFTDVSTDGLTDARTTNDGQNVIIKPHLVTL